MDTITAKLAFQGVSLKPVKRDGQTWLRISEIEDALGYAAKGRALAKIYNAHADEFASTMTRVLKLATAGGKQAVRVFSLRGAHLLAMFARTPVAKAFRIWVLNILDAEVAKPTRQQVKSYHYPLSAAKPHDGIDQIKNDWLTPRALLDAHNRALELELLAQLARDGHDVEGVRMRILAMRDGLERAERARARMANWEQRARALGDEFEAYGREQGKNVIFGRAPDPRNALEAFTYADQLPRGESEKDALKAIQFAARGGM